MQTGCGKSFATDGAGRPLLTRGLCAAHTLDLIEEPTIEKWAATCSGCPFNLDASTELVTSGVLPIIVVPQEKRTPVSRGATAPPSSVAPVDPTTPGELLPLPQAAAATTFSVRELLSAACPWLTQSGSLMGWSKLSTAKACLRQFYYQHVLGLRRRSAPAAPTDEASSASRRPRLSALEVGTLVHAVIERFYSTGSPDRMWDPVRAIQPSYPALALEVRRLANFYFQRFNTQETRSWDMRAVELESRYYFPARRCGGKRRSLCISCRHDGIYRLLQPGDGRLPRGAVAEEVRIHELKTTSTLTGARLQAFYQDAQIVLNVLAFNSGRAVGADGTVSAASTAQLVGPAQIVTVTFVGKGTQQDPNKDIARVDYLIPAERAHAFAADIGDWYYAEVGERLFHDQWQQAATWRKDWTCKDRHYSGWTCPYIGLCTAGGSQIRPTEYEVREPLQRELLELPKRLAKPLQRRTRTAKKEAEGK